VTLRPDGTLWLLDKQTATPNAKVSRDELLAHIKAKQARLPDQPVVISAGGSTRYKEVIELLDLLQTNGVQKVGLLAQPTGR